MSPILADEGQLAAWNATLAGLTPAQRVEWAFANLPGEIALTSSFGAQAAISLHLVTQVRPEVPVILIDTGYLFPETYQFIEQLTERLKLNLKVYAARRSAAWQEAINGRRWEQGVEGITAYNLENKIEPLERALQELGIHSWFAGLRREQSESRKDIPFVRVNRGRYAVYPIADLSNRDVHFYLKEHGLPYHPLWDQGYVSIGDVHTTRPITDGLREEDTRFFGLKRECGLHNLAG